LRKLGHDVRLMPAKDVKAYVKRNKIDAVDLEYVLRDIQTDRGNLHVDGSPHVIRLRRTTLWHFDAGSGRRPPAHTRCGQCSCGAALASRPPERDDRVLAAWYRSSHEVALAQRGLIRKQGGSDEEMDCT
jgi:hypothetical protein